MYILYDAAHCDNVAGTAGGRLEAEEAATTIRRLSLAETLPTLSRDSLHSRPTHCGGRVVKNGGASEIFIESKLPPSLPLVSTAVTCVLGIYRGEQAGSAKSPAAFGNFISVADQPRSTASAGAPTRPVRSAASQQPAAGQQQPPWAAGRPATASNTRPRAAMAGHSHMIPASQHPGIGTSEPAAACCSREAAPSPP
jgi:hypothetical protein